jgi:hypothetical protein
VPKTPSYRRRKNYTQAIVTLTDSGTGRRRDYWLGEHGSRESREVYHQLIARWEPGGRRLPDDARDTPPSKCDAVTEVMAVKHIVKMHWPGRRALPVRRGRHPQGRAADAPRGDDPQKSRRLSPV